jgi:hypothetical protein
MPATGVRAPERTVVAVHAIAQVAGRPPKKDEKIFATSLCDELHVRIVLVVAHLVGDDGRE